MIKKKSTLMKRKWIAVIVAAAAVLVLAVTLAVVLDYVNATSVEDPADGTVYYVRKKDKVYSLYDTDKKTVMPTEEQYGYYVTHAGTLVDVDSETGEYEIIAAVDTEGNEQLGFNMRVLMFPHIEKANILKLEVHNEHGDFTFARTNLETGKLDINSSFTIVGSPLVSFDEELFASLYVSAGYTLTTRKIVDPIKDENGEFSEYGLVPERRVREVMTEDGEFDLNDDGSYKYEEYDYVPAYYILTDKDGNDYKVIIGDLMVTGGGYYVQYVDMSGETEVKRDAVYVLSADLGDSMLVPVEDFVTPQLTYPMSLNNYFDVANFYIFNKKKDYVGIYECENEHDGKECGWVYNEAKGYEEGDIAPGTKFADLPEDFVCPVCGGEKKNIVNNVYDDPVVGFSYVDLSERENTIKATEPYVFLEGFGLDGYMTSSNNIDAALQGLYSPSFVGVAKLAPTIEDFVKYGLAFETTDENGEKTYEISPEHVVSFNFDMTDDSGNYVGTINHRIFISALTKDNTRYAFTEIYEVDKNGKVSKEALYDYGMIVEVNDHSLEFLNWDSYDWINASYVNLNIAFCDKITLDAPGYSAAFELDNTASDSTESISSTNLKVHATDSTGNDKTTFSQLVVTDKSGNIWTVSATEIKCYSSTGTELTIKTAYYDYNVMGTQVRVVSGYIECADGSKVYVSADEVRIETLGGGVTTYVRYDTNLFRQFYKTLLYASISDSYELSDEEAATVPTEENLMLTMTITDSTGVTKTYRFYKLTSRKAYITINGNGGFYVLNNRVEKFITDAQKFFAGELIDATAKK